MKRVVDYLSDLIRIQSNSAVSNRPIVEYATDALHAAGWSTRELPYRGPSKVEKVNLIAAPHGQNVDARDVDLAFMCHTDTVPFAPEWRHALDPYVANGMVHGCGACDVKGFLACLLAAASEDNPARFSEGLRIVLTADEEIGCVGALRLIEEEILHPRRMVIGEPTSLHPARAGKGYCLAEITVFGKEAHSAHPDEGVSAIYNAMRLIGAIEHLEAEVATERHEFFEPDFTTLNIGTIHGGSAKNIVPGQCQFQLEWRPIPSQEPDAVFTAVKERAAQLHVVDPEFRASVRLLRQYAGFETGADSPLVRWVESLTGKAAVSIPFASEASVFAPVAEEIVVFGPGDMHTAHSSRECVPIDELQEAVRSIRTLMRPT